MLFLDHTTQHMPYSSFKAIMNLCFQYSQYFSLTLHDLPGKTCELESELAPFIHRNIVTTRWFKYGRMEYNPLEIYLYPVNIHTKAIMDIYYHTFFLYSTRNNLEGWEQSLEDLCFFASDKLILGTVSHEYYCNIYPPNEDFARQIIEIYCHWQTGEDDGEKISLCEYTTL